MKIAVIGGGLMARAIVYDLVHVQGIEEVVVLERDGAALEALGRCVGAARKPAGSASGGAPPADGPRGRAGGTASGTASAPRPPGLDLRAGDLTDPATLRAAVAGSRVVVSAVPYRFNVALLEAAIAAGAHFVDLGGNMDVVRAQFEIDGRAREAGITAIPACGLAPGTLSVLAMRGIEMLDEAREVRMYCGGLPQHPEPPLDYQIVFSADGLINEYVEPVEIIEGGEVRTVPALEGLVGFEWGEGAAAGGPGTDAVPGGAVDPARAIRGSDGGGSVAGTAAARDRRESRPLEAFYTSGNTGTIVDTLAGRVESLTYRTIRYAGHRDRVKVLFDLGLGSSEGVEVRGVVAGDDVRAELCKGEGAGSGKAIGVVVVSPRRVFEALLERHLPPSGPDLIIARVEVEGTLDGRPATIRLGFTDRHDPATGLSAMARCTGFSAAIVAGMLARGEIAAQGVVALEKAVLAGRYLAELGRRGIRVKDAGVEPR